MSALTDELRRRLDVPVDLVSDEILDGFLAVAGNNIRPWMAPETVNPNPFQANVDEATLQLAVKLWDISNKGVNPQDGAGDWIAPPPAATPGLIRSVFGVLGPALATGGVSV